MARFGRVLNAMVTPFDPAGRLDVEAAVDLARWLVEAGNDGLVVTGTTGESPTLTDTEDRELWQAVIEAVDVPVVVGAGNNDTASSIERVKAAEAAGAAGVLTVTPYYNRPSQAGLVAHFSALATATTLPVMLYDIPVRTGRKLAAASTIALARSHPNIVAVKDAAGDPAGAAALLAEAPDGFELYSGDDALTLPLLAVGAVGTVSVASAWAAAEIAAMIEAFAVGDVQTARRLNARLIPSYRFESSDEAPNPVPTKALLSTMGLGVGEPRPPLGPTPPGLADEGRRVLAELRSAGDRDR